MMPLLIFLLFTSTSFAAVDLKIDFNKVCQNESCINYQNGKDLYKSAWKLDPNQPAKYITKIFNIDSLACIKTNNCYVFLGFVSDTFSIRLNDHILTNLINNKSNYVSHDSTLVMLPIDFINKNENILTVEVFDINKYHWGLLNNNIIITDYSNARHLVFKDWIIRTGFTIFSSYFLFIFSLLALFTFAVLRRKNILYILSYCGISTLYLISFSEIPREFFDPEILSGIIHFPLRLLQDFTLFIVFHKILNRENSFKLFFRTVVVLYMITLGAYGLLAIQGLHSFSTSKYIILIAAPLVATPMGYGFALALKHFKGVDRGILVPIFFTLFLFQLNDLFLFWQLIPSYFMVKFYIPFVVILLTFIEIRKYAMDYTFKTLMAEKVQNAKQIVHDIRSPLSALNILSDKINIRPEEKELLVGAIQAIDGIASSLTEQTINILNNKAQLINVIQKIIVQKKIEYPNLAIEFSHEGHDSDLCVGDSLEISRIFSNLINNSIEATDDSPKIQIFIKRNRKHFHISLKDNGKGIPRDVLRKIGTFGYSYGKENFRNRSGSGLGLYNAFKTVERWGGNIKITSEIGNGTEVMIKLPRFEHKELNQKFSYM